MAMIRFLDTKELSYIGQMEDWQKTLLDKTEQILRKIEQLPKDSWALSDWLGLTLGIVGIGVGIYSAYESVRARKAADNAREAANLAASFTKIKSIAPELLELKNEIKAEEGMSFQKANSQYDAFNSKIRRLIAVYQNDEKLKEDVRQILSILDDTLDSLHELKSNGEPDTIIQKDAVYYALFRHYSKLKGTISTLIGKIENIRHE